MSKIKNGGLDQYGAEPIEQQQFGTAGAEGVKATGGKIAPKMTYNVLIGMLNPPIQWHYTTGLPHNYPTKLIPWLSSSVGTQYKPRCTVPRLKR